MDVGGDHLGDSLGVEWLEVAEAEARARLAVSERILQPAGLVHGGAYCVLAESLCSEATSRAVADRGMVAMGQSNLATFLRPITEGHLNASARRLHGGSSTWIWDVEISDDDGRACALVRITIAVRPRRGSQA